MSQERALPDAFANSPLLPPRSEKINLPRPDIEREIEQIRRAPKHGKHYAGKVRRTGFKIRHKTSR